jgi:hypothetical protein
MIRIIICCVVVIAVFSETVTAEDSRYYSLVNRLNKVEAGLVELKRLKRQVSQLEIMHTQQKRRIQDESWRMDSVSEQNKSLLTFVNSICESERSQQQYREACQRVTQKMKQIQKARKER